MLAHELAGHYPGGGSHEPGHPGNIDNHYCERAGGFSKATIRNIRVETNQNLNVPVSMSLASASETVDVSDAEPLLNTAEIPAAP